MNIEAVMKMHLPDLYLGKENQGTVENCANFFKNHSCLLFSFGNRGNHIKTLSKVTELNTTFFFFSFISKNVTADKKYL